MLRRAPAAIPLVASGLAIAALLMPGNARANVTIQGTGTVTAGYTDNVLSAPDQPIVGGAPREGDALFQIIPGAVLTSVAPRLLERLAYTFTADLFARHTEANTYSNRLEWLATILTSPKTKLTLSLQSQQGRVSTFLINQPSAATTVGVLSTNNDTNFFAQDVVEALDATPLADWHVTEGITFHAFVPIDRGKLPDSYSVIAGAGVDRLFRYDGVGLLLNANFIQYIQPRDPTTDVAIGFDDRQVLTSLVARWRRDWSRAWSTEAQLGVISLVGASADPAASTETAWQPSALAALRWANERGNAELHYLHTAAPNTLAGNTFSVDEVALQAGVPIYRDKVSIAATVAYQHARFVALVPGAPEATGNVAVVDVTVGYQPIPEVGVFARYSLFDQFGSPPVNNVPSVLPDLTRNVVMVGATVTYPVRAAARVPTAGASRIDGADQPDFPEPHATEQPQR
ncbi:MAG TPA: hypothetical protein VHV78_10950 [Gemmatimonadaceae bacterium]|nr:hypothetical protein [Gemmatimonadaceae bacterium]